MSVAFRRESDEEHREPRFELPIPPGPNLVTARGLVLIAARVEELRAAVADEADADRRGSMERDLRYWTTRHATAELAPHPPPGEIGIGSRATVRMNGGLRTIHVTGMDEAEPAAGLIGFQAPLAQALIGGQAGERVDFNGVAEAIEIVSIEQEDR